TLLQRLELTAARKTDHNVAGARQLHRDRPADRTHTEDHEAHRTSLLNSSRKSGPILVAKSINRNNFQVASEARHCLSAVRQPGNAWGPGAQAPDPLSRKRPQRLLVDLGLG